MGLLSTRTASGPAASMEYSRMRAVGALLLLLAMAWWQSARLAASLESVFLTPIASMMSPADAGQLWKVEIIQYWIGAFTWSAAMFMAVRRIVRTRKFSAAAAMVRRTTPRFRRGTVVLSCFVFLALTGPLFTTADPFGQGPLETTRLLHPFSRGHLTVSAPRMSGGPESSTLNRLQRANWFLGSGLSAWPEPGEVQTNEVLLLLGSDAVGRDVFSRLLYGTHVSLGIGLAAALGALLLGSLVGFLSGYAGGNVDRILMWGADVFLSVPTLFLIIALVFFVGGSVAGIVLVLTFSGWMRIARLVRGEVLHLRDREFIQTARLLGQSSFRIIRRHLFPNVLPVLVSAAVLQVSDSMLAEASLGFLGFGVQPPVPSWGNMLGDSLAHLEQAWWLAAAPGLFLTVLMTALHATSEELQEMLRI